MLEQMTDVWHQIEEVLAKNEEPQVTIFPVNFIKKYNCRVRRHPKPILGKSGQRIQQFTDGYLLTEFGSRMRCRRDGCNKYISVDSTSICCSKECEALLRDYCEEVLAVLNKEKPAKDFPVYYRNSKAKDRWKKLMEAKRNEVR